MCAGKNRTCRWTRTERPTVANVRGKRPNPVLCWPQWQIHYWGGGGDGGGHCWGAAGGGGAGCGGYCCCGYAGGAGCCGYGCWAYGCWAYGCWYCCAGASLPASAIARVWRSVSVFTNTMPAIAAMTNTNIAEPCTRSACVYLSMSNPG